MLNIYIKEATLEAKNSDEFLAMLTDTAKKYDSIESQNSDAAYTPQNHNPENLARILKETAKVLREEGMPDGLVRLSLAALCGVQTTPIKLSDIRLFA